MQMYDIRGLDRRMAAEVRSGKRDREMCVADIGAIVSSENALYKLNILERPRIRDPRLDQLDSGIDGTLVLDK
ncbi:hypothetical protein CS8_030370 [Cupriavidus sp. 8B]